MLVRAFRFLDPARISSDLPDRLHALADDCERLHRSSAVPATVLSDAPLLQDWAPVPTSDGVRLAGYVTGHPIHGNCPVVTTPLWWADPSGGWVRSLSRFYRLGACAGDGIVRTAEDRG
jgi:hypothetical protein